MQLQPFSALPLSTSMLDNLVRLGYTEMTPIQAKSLPHLLQRRDMLAQAQTGSGKTLAFGLALLHALDPKRFEIQVLVLCPVRELAEQVAQQLRLLARTIANVKILTLCGGVPLAPQRASLQHGAHIIVATPGRLRDHLGKQTIDLDSVHTLVLDEADRMLDMGFGEEILSIVAGLSKTRHSMLFSATYPEAIETMSTKILSDPLHISVESERESLTIRQRCFVSEQSKSELLLQVLSTYMKTSALIFCNMKTTCDAVTEVLEAHGFAAQSLHSDFEQNERTEILTRFSNGSSNVLVATDVAARGLDIKALELIINYDLPMHSDTYTHRIGRTGRAGAKGLAISLCAPYERKKVTELSAQLTCDSLESLDKTLRITPPQYATLRILGGKKSKLRPGDIVGALSAGGIEAAHIGNINVYQALTYVAIKQHAAKAALDVLQHQKIKGRAFRVSL